MAWGTPPLTVSFTLLKTHTTCARLEPTLLLFTRREEDRPIGRRLRKVLSAQTAQHIVPVRRIIRHNHPCLELRPRAHLLR